MREYSTQAIILDREPQGELDARITLWSRTLGKLRGRATSLRKITSKLSAHLEPGMLSDVRMVENRNLQIVDALKIRRLAIPAPDMPRLARLLAEGEPDEELWAAITAPQWSWSAVLGALGWDPQGAVCMRCGRRPEAFSIASQDFFCEICASKLPADTLIYIHNAAV
jgi:recombinational DNA repair protein (RecF pathway)